MATFEKQRITYIACIEPLQTRAQRDRQPYPTLHKGLHLCTDDRNLGFLGVSFFVNIRFFLGVRNIALIFSKALPHYITCQELKAIQHHRSRYLRLL